MKTYRLLTVTVFLLSLTLSSSGQINVALLHQLVGDSETEHDKQTKAKEQQTKNTVVEESNRSLLKTVKGKYRTLQNRFAKMSIVFDAGNIGISAAPLVREIITHQQQIVSYVNKDPTLIPLALESEAMFVKRSQSLLNYLVGLCAVIGDVNQMKVSDRRILFSYILEELKEISYISGGVSRALRASVIKSKGSDPFRDYVNRESGIVDEIMNNAKILKQ